MTTAHNVPAETNPKAARALRIIESMPTFAWSADPSGRYTYVSPNALAYLGTPQEDLNPLPDGDEFGWRQVVHPDDYGRVAARWRHCLQTGDDYDAEQRLRRADGVYRWFRNFGRVSRDSHGRIIEWCGTTIDIDERKQAEAALRDRERELSQLVDMVPSHLWRLAPDGEPIFFNKRMVDFLGRDVADTDKPGMSRLEMLIQTTIHPDDAATLREVLGNCLATGESFELRYRLRRADGVYRWMSSRAEPMRDERGGIIQWYGLAHDVDDQVHADEALRRSEQQLQQLIDAVPAIIWSMTPEGIPSYLNKRHTDLIGVPLKDLIATDGSRRLSLAHPDDRETLNQELGRAIKAGKPFVGRYRQRRANGPHRWVESRAEPLRDDSGNIIQWYGVNVDIHDLVTAQEALRARERQLQQLIDTVPAVIWCTTPEGIPCYLNKWATDVTGLTLKDLIAPDGSRSLPVVHPDDREAFDQALARSFKTGTSFVGRYRQRRADGPHRWVESRAEPLRDDSGNIVQWYGVSVDIHDLVTAQEAIRQSERRLQQMIDAVPVNILSFSAAGEPTYINKRYKDYLGLTVPHFDSLQEQQRAIIHPDDFAEMYGTLSNCFQTGAPFLMRYRRRGKDGIYRWTEGRAEPLRDQDGTIVQWYAVSLDIEDEMRAQQAEEALRQTSDKLAKATQAASLAELSASIAHEVNQPLAAIVANSHACQRWLSAEPPNMERAKITVERVIRDANSAADVVSRIRALFKQSVETRTSIQLPGVIAEALDLMAEEAARRRVRMDVDVEDNLPLVACDRVQLQQVLINIIRNGMDAMDSIAGDRALAMRVRRMGDVIRTEISDRGRGVEFPDKMFEAFFTTKQNGMGMGLAICRTIVESHGGRLWVENNDPQGATFIFTLPVVGGEQRSSGSDVHLYIAG
jgi:PAS domain S-box-containing protein